MTALLNAREKLARFFTDNGFVVHKEESVSVTLRSDGNPTKLLLLDQETIEHYASIAARMDEWFVDPYPTAVTGPTFREQMVEFVSDRMIIPGRSEVTDFSNETSGIRVEIGPASKDFLMFMATRKERIPHILEQLDRSYFVVSTPPTIFGIMSRIKTIRITGLLAKPTAKEQAHLTKLFEGCLFELTFLRRRTLELVTTWPTRRNGLQRPFSTRKARAGRSFLLKNVIYDSNSIKFYQRASASNDPYIQFISYYHILEQHFISVSDGLLYKKLRNLLNDPGFRPRPRQLDQLIYSVEEHKRTNDETEMLKNVLLAFVDEGSVIEFVQKYEEYENAKIYTNQSECFGERLDKLNLSEGHIFGALAKRIKFIRNTLVHSSDRYGRKDRYVPGDSANSLLRREIPLLKFVAEQVIISTSENVE